MKRRSALFLSALMLMLMFAGCSAAPSEDPGEDPGVTAKEDAVCPLESGDNIHTIAFVSDTQRWSGSTFDAVFDSIVADSGKYNIEYVVHTGDIIQEGGDPEAKWEAAKAAISKLDGKIPYGILAGNHDQVDGSDNPFEVYSKYFGDECYSGRDYEVASYENCRAHAQLVTIGSTDFVFVFISYGPNGECIKFANEVFAKYPDRVGVLCTHEYLTTDLELSDMGEYMLKKIVEQSENVKMVLCGHESGAGCYTITTFDGRQVVQILANYQDANNEGTILYLQINEETGKLEGISYSPVTNSDEGYRDSDADRFTADITW